MKMDNLTKAMIDRKVRSPFDLTEFDQWVNDATRKDINEIAKNQEVFGLHVWDFKILERKELLGKIYNFGVDHIFENKDRERVLSAIEQYKSKKISAQEFLDLIFPIAVYSCMWV
jgi:hypothetical protein